MASLAPPSPKPRPQPVGLLKVEPSRLERYSHAAEILARLAKRETKR
jgi:hypothetical protein